MQEMLREPGRQLPVFSITLAIVMCSPALLCTLSVCMVQLKWKRNGFLLVSLHLFLHQGNLGPYCTQLGHYYHYYYSDSKAMCKLRSAIWGKRGTNLDDLEFMTGKIG